MLDKIRCLNCNKEFYRDELILCNDYNGEIEHCPNCGTIQFINGYSYTPTQSPHSLQTYYEITED